MTSNLWSISERYLLMISFQKDVPKMFEAAQRLLKATGSQ